MKIYSFFIAFFFLFSVPIVAQKIIVHKVKSGESIYSIAKKYDVTEKEIYALNPKLKGTVLGLKEAVKIPNKSYKPEDKKPKTVKKEEIIVAYESTDTRHLVLPKETLYSISKKYRVTMESLCDMNPELKTGNLKSGMRLKLPYAAIADDPIKLAVSITDNELEQQKSEDVKGVVIKPISQITASTEVIHKVQPKETLFRISKKYGVSVAELQKINPNLPSGLPVGYDLIVKEGSKEKEIITETVSISTPKEVIEVKPLSLENVSKADFLIAKASENLGIRYRSGGTTTAGFDCSGLMFTTFKNIEMTLPRSSHDMANYGQRIDKSQAQKGDLIFFATFGKGRVSHVGMVTEVVDDEIKFIHSSTSSGVIISSTKESYYAKSFVQVNRVLLE